MPVTWEQQCRLSSSSFVEDWLVELAKLSEIFVKTKDLFNSIRRQVEIKVSVVYIKTTSHCRRIGSYDA